MRNLICLFVAVTALLAPSQVQASNVYLVGYGSAGCAGASAVAQAVTAGQCLAFAAYGSTVSTMVTCSGTTSSSSWSATVYSGSTCAGSSFGTLSATGNAQCGSATYQGDSISAYVDCSGSSISPPYKSSAVPQLADNMYALFLILAVSMVTLQVMVKF